jgi:hypothetical protein
MEVCGALKRISELGLVRERAVEAYLALLVLAVHSLNSGLVSLPPFRYPADHHRCHSPTTYVAAALQPRACMLLLVLVHL